MKIATQRIKVSKFKTIGLLLGCLVFVAIGSWMIYLSLSDTNILAIVMSAIAVLFFGIGFFIILIKSFDKSLGIIISNEGITDNISQLKTGPIEWQDIQFVKIEKVSATKMLLIFVDNPYKYINRAKEQRGMKNNLALMGTPFCIPSSFLSCSLKKLEELINAELTKYHRDASK